MHSAARALVDVVVEYATALVDDAEEEDRNAARVEAAGGRKEAGGDGEAACRGSMMAEDNKACTDIPIDGDSGILSALAEASPLQL